MATKHVIKLVRSYGWPNLWLSWLTIMMGRFLYSHKSRTTCVMAKRGPRDAGWKECCEASRDPTVGISWVARTTEHEGCCTSSCWISHCALPHHGSDCWVYFKANILVYDFHFPSKRRATFFGSGQKSWLNPAFCFHHEYPDISNKQDLNRLATPPRILSWMVLLIWFNWHWIILISSYW